MKKIIVVISLILTICFLFIGIFLSKKPIILNPVVISEKDCHKIADAYFDHTDPLVKTGDYIEQKKYRVRQQELYVRIFEICELDFRDEKKFNQLIIK